MTVFGTRPEAIKMAPLVKEMQRDVEIQPIVCVTGQHREMLDQVLKVFEIEPEYDLSIMKKGQTLFDITASTLQKLKAVYEEVKPDLVLVHGDTTTTFAASLAAFYMNIPVGHVEAGLRTYNMQSPFPEEFNRQAVGLTASFHFAPTEAAKNNLLKEGKLEENIFVTGNTAIDALKTTVKGDYSSELTRWAEGSRLIVLTAHRRENLGQPLKNMFNAIKKTVQENQDVKVIYPVHLNPIVRQTASEILGDEPSIRLIEPLDVINFHNLLAKSYLILTDSGGIQEEAPALGKPVLVMRDTTERPEGVQAGTLKLTGTEEDAIYKAFDELLNDESVYKQMSEAVNPYGDGTASKQICEIIKRNF